MLTVASDRLPVRLLIDVDNTLNDLTTHFFKWLDKMGVEYDSYINNYDLKKCIKSPKRNKIFKLIMNNPEFWKTIPFLPEAIDMLQSLNKLTSLYIVTVPFSKGTAEAKYQTIANQFPFIKYDHIIFYEKKWELEADIIVDDKPETLLKCNENGMITVKKRQPYNLSVPSHFEFETWKEARVIFPKVLTYAIERKNLGGTE